MKENRPIEQITYAGAVTQDKRLVSHVPPIFIQAKKHDMKKKAHNIVVNRLLNDIILPIGKINENKDGTVIIKCANKQDVTQMEELLKNKIGHDFNVK